MTDAYAASGVSVTAASETVERYRKISMRRRDPRILAGIGGFAGCFEFSGYREPVLVSSTDGVGTKVLIAAALQRYDTVGRDLVNHCVNDILCLNADPLFFLDYLAVGRLDPHMAEELVSTVADACAELGIALLGGETAEMPDVYSPEHFDLAGTIVGVVERSRAIDISTVSAGDVIVGLPANGFHTNGYSLVRKVLGRERWTQTVDGTSIFMADALLAVHPCYLSSVRAVQEAGVAVKAMAHITGGGPIKNLPRALPPGCAAVLEKGRIGVPPLMAQVVREARLSEPEAYSTFNMGLGFCLVVAQRAAERAVRAAREALARTPIAGLDGRTAEVVGKIERARPDGCTVELA